MLPDPPIDSASTQLIPSNALCRCCPLIFRRQLHQQPWRRRCAWRRGHWCQPPVIVPMLLRSISFRRQRLLVCPSPQAGGLVATPEWRCGLFPSLRWIGPFFRRPSFCLAASRPAPPAAVATATSNYYTAADAALYGALYPVFVSSAHRFLGRTTYRSRM